MRDGEEETPVDNVEISAKAERRLSVKSQMIKTMDEADKAIAAMKQRFESMDASIETSWEVCHAMLCRAVPWHAVLCCAML